MTTQKTGLILFAHGSRDAAWRQPLDQIQQAVAKQYQGACTLAFLEFMDPTLEQAFATLLASGVQRIRILPLFWSSGKHVLEDLRELVAQFNRAHPQIEVTLSASLGESEVLRQAIVHWALQENTSSHAG